LMPAFFFLNRYANLCQGKRVMGVLRDGHVDGFSQTEERRTQGVPRRGYAVTLGGGAHHFRGHSRICECCG
jgi:hypothetical protein